jgi:hypothetical protein
MVSCGAPATSDSALETNTTFNPLKESYMAMIDEEIARYGYMGRTFRMIIGSNGAIMDQVMADDGENNWVDLSVDDYQRVFDNAAQGYMLLAMDRAGVAGEADGTQSMAFMAYLSSPEALDLGFELVEGQCLLH